MNSVTSFNVDEVANRNEERLRRLELIQRGGGQGGRGSLQGDPDQVLQRFIDERRYLYHTCSNFISLPTGSQLGLVGASQVWSRAGLSSLTDSPFTCFAHGLSLAELFSVLAGSLFAGYSVMVMNIDLYLYVNKHWSVFLRKPIFQLCLLLYVSLFSFHTVVPPTLPADFQKPHLKRKHHLNLFRLLDSNILSR